MSKKKKKMSITRKIIRRYIIMGLVCITAAILITRHVIKPPTDYLRMIRYNLKSQNHPKFSQRDWKLLKTRLLSKKSSPITIYAITATYSTYVQEAELTRISQTLQLSLLKIHWIVVEDSKVKSVVVKKVLKESNLPNTHLNVETSKLKKTKWRRHTGITQWNEALKWIRANCVQNTNKGVVYFMDTCNTYDVRIFEEIVKIKKVGVWPVGLLYGVVVHSPILDEKNGKVKSFKNGWMPSKPFLINEAEFAINLDLILAKNNLYFTHKMDVRFEVSDFLASFVKIEELETLANNCSQVYVWKTNIEKPIVKGIVPNLEV